MSSISEFKIAVPQDDLDDLSARLRRVRFANELPGGSDEAGLRLDYIKRLVEYWRDEYDWRGVEARLNQLPQYVTLIDGQRVHFIHVKSAVPGARALLLTHGWPTTFVEYTNVIDRLVNPIAHGGNSEDAFHVVIPSLPGFGFSGPTTEAGWNRYRVARAWKELMRRLGYDRYDVGSLVSPEVGRVDPEHVMGVHVTQLFSFPSGDPAELGKLSPEEHEQLKVLQWFEASMNGYQKLQQTKPQNIGHAIADSPAGQLAWSAQLFGEVVTPEFIITNVMIYWLTNTGASSARIYYEDAHAADVPSTPTQVPIGLSNFAWDFQSIRSLAERDHRNIVFWNRHQAGGHFATQMTPDLWVDDMRKFARLVG